MSQKNYYSILGLAQDATLADIKKAYRRLAFRYHPDQNRGGIYGEERFREVKEAYDILSDPQKRRHFDASMRSKHVYAPSYNFFKYSTPNPPPEPPREVFVEEEKMTPAERLQFWLKPIMLIIISALLMWLIMNPPSWLARFMTMAHPQTEQGR